MAENLKGTMQDPKFIKYLLDPEEEYNCYFLVGNSEISKPEKIGVVKKMLLAHSLVFRRELQESQIKEKGVVKISDMFPDTFRNLLRFVYGFDNTATLCFDEADDLFYASEKYMITGLKARLATRLIELLTPDNICSLMNNPACSSELQLNSAITHILQGETGRVLSTPQFLDLTGTAFNRIIEQEALSIPEIELWRAALKWAKHKTGSEDALVLRNQLKEQTKHILICTLSESELCGEVFPSGLLTSKEVQLVCLARRKKEKQDGLVDFCNEIQPRKRRLKPPIVQTAPQKPCNQLTACDHIEQLLGSQLIQRGMAQDHSQLIHRGMAQDQSQLFQRAMDQGRRSQLVLRGMAQDHSQLFQRAMDQGRRSQLVLRGMAQDHSSGAL